MFAGSALTGVIVTKRVKAEETVTGIGTGIRIRTDPRISPRTDLRNGITRNPRDGTAERTDRVAETRKKKTGRRVIREIREIRATRIR